MQSSPMVVSFALLAGTSALAQAGNANVESMAKQCQIWKTVEGGTVNEALMERIMGEMTGLYAPTIDCNQVATNPEFGFSLAGVPVTTCMGEATKKYGGLRIIEFKCDDIAQDESGKSVMVYTKLKFQLPTGQTTAVPSFAKYDFGDDGKIIAYSSQFDTSVLDGMTPASKNSAAIAKQCQVAREIQGATVNEALMKRIMPELIGLYAEKVDCNQVATNPDFGWSLAGVPFTTCMGEAAKKYGGMQIIDFDCKDIAADSSGKSVMLYQPTKLKLPTGELVAVPFFSKYDFDDAGKIVAYSTQFDASVLTTSAVLLASTAPWNPSPTLALSAACLAAAAALVHVIARQRQPSRLLEGYEECA